MKSLRYCSTLQFFSLNGNQLHEESDDFNKHLVKMLTENTKYLTHLDLSGLKMLKFQRILQTITKYSQSLQVIHLDNNSLTQEQKLMLAQKLGVLEYPGDSGFAKSMVTNSA